MIFGGKKQQLENQTLKSELSNAQNEIDLLKQSLEQEKQKNLSLKAENELLKKDSEKVLSKAKQEASEILNGAHERYKIELNRLKVFINQWQSALPEPKEQTPETKKRRALAVALAEILKNNPCTNNIDEGVELLQKLSNAISGKGEESGGFNLDEVLNPSSELDLATLCKELGVMD